MLKLFALIVRKKRGCPSRIPSIINYDTKMYTFLYDTHKNGRRRMNTYTAYVIQAKQFNFVSATFAGMKKTNPTDKTDEKYVAKSFAIEK